MEIIFQNDCQSLIINLIWSIRCRRTYFKGLSEDQARRWIKEIENLGKSNTDTLNEKINHIFNPLDQILGSEEKKSSQITRWKKLECVLEGSIVEQLQYLDGSDRAKYFNILINQDGLFQNLEIQKLKWNAKDQFALNVDILLKDNSSKKILLIELKRNSKYDLNQFLKYYRIKSELNKLGFDVIHLLIGKHSRENRLKSFKNLSQAFYDSNDNVVLVNKNNVSKDQLSHKWWNYFTKVLENADIETFPIQYFSYTDLKIVAQQNFDDTLVNNFDYIINHFN